MPRRQQPAPPPCNAAKMSPRISVGPEPFLDAHAPSPPAAGSHCPAREVSAPYCWKGFCPREGFFPWGVLVFQRLLLLVQKDIEICLVRWFFIMLLKMAESVCSRGDPLTVSGRHAKHHRMLNSSNKSHADEHL
jgi:hypothetical protein